MDVWFFALVFANVWAIHYFNLRVSEEFPGRL